MPSKNIVQNTTGEHKNSGILDVCVLDPSLIYLELFVSRWKREDSYQSLCKSISPLWGMMAVLRKRDHAVIQTLLNPTAHTLSKSQLTQLKRSPHCTQISSNVHSGISFEVVAVVSHYYLENNFLFQLSNHITPKDKENMLSLKKHLSRNLTHCSRHFFQCATSLLRSLHQLIPATW